MLARSYSVSAKYNCNSDFGVNSLILTYTLYRTLAPTCSNFTEIAFEIAFEAKIPFEIAFEIAFETKIAFEIAFEIAPCQTKLFWDCFWDCFSQNKIVIFDFKIPFAEIILNWSCW